MNFHDKGRTFGLGTKTDLSQIHASLSLSLSERNKALRLLCVCMLSVHLSPLSNARTDSFFDVPLMMVFGAVWSLLNLIILVIKKSKCFIDKVLCFYVSLEERTGSSPGLRRRSERERSARWKTYGHMESLNETPCLFFFFEPTSLVFLSAPKLWRLMKDSSMSLWPHWYSASWEL